MSNLPRPAIAPEAPRKDSDGIERVLDNRTSLLHLMGGASESPMSDQFTGRCSDVAADGAIGRAAAAAIEAAAADDIAGHAAQPLLVKEPAGKPALAVRRKGTAWTAAANLSKAFLGAASFELPWALKQSGIGFGVLSLIAFAFACAYTLKLLGRLRLIMLRRGASPFITYVDIGRAAYGAAGVRAVNFGVIAMSLGVCAAYLVFVGTTLHSVFVNVGVYPKMSLGTPPSCNGATDTGTGCIFLPLVITLPVFIGIAMLNDYSKLAWTSLAGIFFVVVAMLATLLHGALTQPIAPASHFPFVRVQYYPLFFGNAAFTFCIHTVAIPIHASMADPERDFEPAVNRSTAFVAVINIIFAVVCAVLFEHAGVMSNVVQNLPQGEQLVVLIKVLLCCVMILTYALFLQPVAEVLENAVWKEGVAVSLNQRRSLRLGVILLTTCLALAVPDFGLACNLVGSVANTLVGLVLPPIFFLKLQPDVTRRERLACHIIVGFGLVLFAVSTIVSIIAIYGVHNPRATLCKHAPFDTICTGQ